MLTNYIGKWNQQRMMLPVEFITERNISNIKIQLPKPPSKTNILNHDKPIKEQRWVIPKIYTEQELGQLNPIEVENYFRQERDRRKNGLFFYNCGGIEYITGVHYHYLTYWKISGTGSPDFRDSDRDFFYCWDSVVNDSDCYGLLFFTNRRDGKALDIKTPIPTPNGWTTMESLKEGDFVFDSQGNPTRVTFATDIQLDRKCYELTFSDNNKIVADADHQWIISYPDENKVHTTKELLSLCSDKKIVNKVFSDNKWIEVIRYIDDITEVESRPVKCISVDSPDQSYLCGKNYIVTHNTEKSLNILYEYISKTEEVNAGIQSQTIDDAKQIFQRLVYSWRKMPSYFKPIDSGDKNPKMALRFEEPSIRSTKGLVKKYKRVLNSIIGFRASSESAYDGYALWRYYCDEFGKFNDGDSYERWKIVKPTLTDGGRGIRGKAIFTTTVEDIEKGGGQAALDMYNDSDPLQVLEDGRTKTGMYRLFKPAYYGFKGYTDEYGYSDIEGAKAVLIAERKGLEGKDLIAIQRKYPFSIKEAFQSSLMGGTFSTQKITEQRDWNVSNNIVPRKGRLIWEDKENYKVRFVDDSSGNLEVSWLPKDEDCNKIVMVNGLPAPTNVNLVSGVDSFDHRTTVDEKKYSQGAMVGFRKYDVANPQHSHSFFLKYLDRPAKETMFYDDVIKASVFFSMGFLHENNKPTIGNYAIDNGFRNYVIRTQQGDYTKSNSRNWINGISTSGEIVREAMIGKMEAYIYDYIGKITPKVQLEKYGIAEKDLNPFMHGDCMFDDLLHDWELFKSTKWTDYDLSVASMLALVAAEPIRNKKKLIIEENKLNISSFFKTYKL